MKRYLTTTGRLSLGVIAIAGALLWHLIRNQ